MRPFVLTIAGHDPSAGAGLTADIKTFEQLKTQGLSVCTAVTVQTENEFHSVNWVQEQLVKDQLETILACYKPTVAKIGIIKSFKLLQEIVQILKDKDINIVWDPVLSSSTGFYFHNKDMAVNQLLTQIDIITPNCIEVQKLFGTNEPSKLQHMSIKNNWNAILLKGGHSENHKGDDLLITANEIQIIKGENQHLLSDKHGTGCILSAAITASLALKNSKLAACTFGKRYIEQAMISNKSLLAYHSK